MKARHVRNTLASLTVILLVAACRQQEEVVLPELNAVYFWRTDFRLDSLELDFLRHHHLSRIYCRYFDVVIDETTHQPMPNATLTFTDRLPDGVELVPTVFITEACMHRHYDGLAQRLVKRVLQMNETHDRGKVEELQIDCDYTARSRNAYYRFLEEVRREAATHGIRLSATIRLHQLSMPAPPVDEGVLMLYNTGDPMHFQERNPILDMRDVAPYLSSLPGYQLPLAAAYPVFRWERNVYGMQIDHEVEANEVLRVKRAVEQRRPELRRRIVTYHLSHENIKRYTQEDYEAIYHH